jgi:thymidylate synthase
MNNLDKQYTALLQDILENGTKKETRNGGTISVFGRQIRHKMSDGFPLLTTKKIAWRSICSELLWFLKGDTSIEYLLENDCNIWTGDAYKRFLNETIKIEPVEVKERAITQLLNSKESKEEFINKIKTDDEFAKKFGDLGKIYGKQWRKWTGYENNTKVNGVYDEYQIDQIANLINDLKTNPDSRRLMVNAWNVGELDQMVLPPCHYGFQVYTRELTIEERLNLASKTYKVFEPFDFNEVTHEEINKLYPVPKRAISLMWSQRSCDFPLGVPANIMSYALLLIMLAKQVNMVPEELIGNLGDCHIYLNQIDGVKEQLTRKPLPLPNVKLSTRIVNDLSEYTYQDIILENYQSHPKIYFPLSN